MSPTDEWILTAECPLGVRSKKRQWLYMNELGKCHHMRRKTIYEIWRKLGKVYAEDEGIPQLDAVSITVEHEVGGRGKLPDTFAIAPTAKAFIDGLVDAGVLLDDNPVHVRVVRFTTPRKTGRNAVTLVIRSAKPGE